MAAPKPPVISVLYFESASPRGSGASDPGIERLPGDLVAYQAFSAAYQAPDRDAGLEILGVFEKAYPQSAYLPSIKGMMDYFPQ